MTLRVTVAVAAAALGSLVPSIMALGSCVAGPELGIAVRQAEVAFVGTVTSTQGEGRWATVLVEEVWAGPDQPATVVVGAVAALGQELAWVRRAIGADTHRNDPAAGDAGGVTAAPGPPTATRPAV